MSTSECVFMTVWGIGLTRKKPFRLCWPLTGIVFVEVPGLGFCVFGLTAMDSVALRFLSGEASTSGVAEELACDRADGPTRAAPVVAGSARDGRVAIGARDVVEPGAREGAVEFLNMSLMLLLW